MNSGISDNKGTASRPGGGGSKGAYAGFLIAGFLMGAALDVKYRPNHIVFEVQPDTKVNVIPSEGDVIEWKSSNPRSGPPSIRFFSSKVPCSEANGSSQCTYTPLPVPQVYLYDCALDKSPNNCYDPGVGPSSNSGGGHSKFVLIIQWIENFVEVVGVDLERLLGFRPKPTMHAWLQGVAGPIAAPAAGAGTTNPPPRHINVAVDCDKNGNAAVFPDGNPADANHAIEASVGDNITWQPYTSYSISDLSVCSPMPLDGTGNRTCALKSGSGDVSYTVRTSGCSNANSVTEHIKLP